MALGFVYTNCPKCDSNEIFEMFRIEAGEVGNAEDLAAYHCNTCQHEWDHELEMKARLVERTD